MRTPKTKDGEIVTRKVHLDAAKVCVAVYDQSKKHLGNIALVLNNKDEDTPVNFHFKVFEDGKEIKDLTQAKLSIEFNAMDCEILAWELEQVVWEDEE